MKLTVVFSSPCCRRCARCVVLTESECVIECCGRPVMDRGGGPSFAGQGDVQKSNAVWVPVPHV